MNPPAHGGLPAGSERQFGRYLVSREIGRGAMGVVYQATDPALGRTVALKTIRLQAASPTERAAQVARLRREAQSGGRLLHPNIVTVFDFFEAGDSAFVCMEFIDGPSLESLLASGQPLDPLWTLSLFRQAADALDFAHSKGVVHRDIKPANLLLQEGRTLKISDFGIARILTEEATATGPLMGTPSYMSPEQAQTQPVGGRSDQFSLAVIAYELLTGRKPFEAYSLAAIVYQVCHDRPAAPSTLQAALDPAVDRVLYRALEKDPELRYPNVTQFVTALEDALARSPGWSPQPRRSPGTAPTVSWPAPPTSRAIMTRPSPQANVARPPRRHAERRSAGWSPWWGALAGFLLAGGAFIALTYRQHSFPSAPLMESPVESMTPAVPDQKPSAAGDDPPRPELGSEALATATAEETASTSPSPADAVSRSEAALPEMETGSPPVPAEALAPKPAPPPAASKPVFQPEEMSTTVDSRPIPHPVRIFSEPSGATVKIDDNPLFTCVTPCQVTLGAGRHTLEFRREGHRPSYQSIEVPQSLVARVRLEQRTGTVMVKSNPPGAAIFINGREWRSRTPARVTLPAGRHRVVLRLEGLPEEASEVEIRDNAVATLEVNWQK